MREPLHVDAFGTCGCQPDRHECYLGDGLYVSFDGSAIKLRAPRSGGDHVVYLDDRVFMGFIEWCNTVAKWSAHIKGRAHNAVD